VCIDQTKQHCRTKRRRQWFLRGSDPSIPVSRSRKWTQLLGAISEDGGQFVARSDEALTQDHAVHFLGAIRDEFDGQLLIVLDNASYFTAKRVQAFADDCEDIELLYLPPYSPELNPVEECWRQLSDRLGNRLFRTLPELKAAIQRALRAISPPDVCNYLCP